MDGRSGPDTESSCGENRQRAERVDISSHLMITHPSPPRPWLLCGRCVCVCVCVHVDGLCGGVCVCVWGLGMFVWVRIGKSSLTCTEGAVRWFDHRTP